MAMLSKAEVKKTTAMRDIRHTTPSTSEWDPTGVRMNEIHEFMGD